MQIILQTLSKKLLIELTIRTDRHYSTPPPPPPTLKDRGNLEDIPVEIILISTFHPSGSFLDSIIRKNRDLLDHSSITRPIINWRITKGFRRPKDLRDHLVRALCNNPMAVRPDSTWVNTTKKGQAR